MSQVFKVWISECPSFGVKHYGNPLKSVTTRCFLIWLIRWPLWRYGLVNSGFVRGQPYDYIRTWNVNDIDLTSDWTIEIEVTSRLMISQSVCLGIEHPCGTCDQILLVQCRSYFTTDSQSVSMSWRRAHLGTCDQILILSEFSCVIFVGRPLWREVGMSLVSHCQQ
jgi:hypothetical protein